MFRKVRGAPKRPPSGCTFCLAQNAPPIGSRRVLRLDGQRHPIPMKPLRTRRTVASRPSLATCSPPDMRSERLARRRRDVDPARPALHRRSCGSVHERSIGTPIPSTTGAPARHQAGLETLECFKAGEIQWPAPPRAPGRDRHTVEPARLRRGTVPCPSRSRHRPPLHHRSDPDQRSRPPPAGFMCADVCKPGQSAVQLTALRSPPTVPASRIRSESGRKISQNAVPICLSAYPAGPRPPPTTPKTVRTRR